MEIPDKLYELIFSSAPAILSELRTLHPRSSQHVGHAAPHFRTEPQNARPFDTPQSAQPSQATRFSLTSPGSPPHPKSPPPSARCPVRHSLPSPRPLRRDQIWVSDAFISVLSASNQRLKTLLCSSPSSKKRPDLNR